MDSPSAGTRVENRNSMLKHQALLVGKLELFRVDLIGKRNYCVLKIDLIELLGFDHVLLVAQLLNLLAIS